VEPSVLTLIAAAQLVRESQDSTDQVWTAAHEVLYAALAEVEQQAAAEQGPEPEKPRTARRRPHWQTSGD
jgi:hypothetical protein